MPLDINLFRKDGGNPELIRESQRRRFASVELVDEIIAKDDIWRNLTGTIDNFRKARNIVQKDIATIKKLLASTKDMDETTKATHNAKCDELVNEKNRLDQEIIDTENKQKALKVEIDAMVNKIGNIVLDSVPVSKDEDADNRIERTWGTPRDPAGLLNHHDLLWRIGGYEPERGAAVVGHRGYFLRDVGVMLNQAFINYGIAFLRKRGYCVLQPPYMMKKDVMAGVAQLEQFDEELYKVSASDEDRYLIATSEQPICAYHKDEWMEEKSLPLYYAGISTCFRKEAGSHGKDTWGIFRVHQFEKVEQFAIVEGDLEKSNAIQEDMIKAAEEFYQSLGFPYRVINIVSGALNNAAIRKFDLEAWFPGYNNYRELVSCSNCTDYQSRAMEIRCGIKKMGDREKKYVHMLNATLCATGRAICCLLETYQVSSFISHLLISFVYVLHCLPPLSPIYYRMLAEFTSLKSLSLSWVVSLTYLSFVTPSYLISLVLGLLSQLHHPLVLQLLPLLLNHQLLLLLLKVRRRLMTSQRKRKRRRKRKKRRKLLQLSQWNQSMLLFLTQSVLLQLMSLLLLRCLPNLLLLRLKLRLPLTKSQLKSLMLTI